MNADHFIDIKSFPTVLYTTVQFLCQIYGSITQAGPPGYFIFYIFHCLTRT